MLINKCFLAGVLMASSAMAQAPFALGPTNPAAPAAPDLNKVIAVVDGKSVTVRDVQEMLQNSPPQLGEIFAVDPRGAIAQYHIMQYLGQQGEAKKLDQRSPLKEQLEAMRFNILAEAMVNDERDGFPVTNEMQEGYYRQHEAEYSQSTVKVIFIGFKPKTSAPTGTNADALKAAAADALAAANNKRTEVEAQEMAADLVKRLKGGANFLDLVASFSEDDPSKKKNGDFGVVNMRSPYPDSFRKPVMALKEGEISDPIRQATGFYIVRVEKKEIQPLSEVRGDIIQTIRQEHLDQWMRDLQSRFLPEVKDPAFFTNPGAAKPPAGPQIAPALK